MRVQLGFAMALIMLELAGCQNPQRLQAIDVGAIAGVQAEISRQVGVYMAAARQPPMVWMNKTLTPIETLPVPDNGQRFACGTGKIGFAISKIKAELTTTLTKSIDASLGLAPPVPVVTVGLTGELNSGSTNTQTLDYFLWPRDEKYQRPALKDFKPTPDEIIHAPIAQVLLDLRQALITSSLRYDYSGDNPVLRPGPRPCFTDYDPSTVSDMSKIRGTEDTYVLGLSVASDFKGGVSIKAVVVTSGLNGEAKSTTGNTLTISYYQTDLEQLQRATAAKEAACKTGSEKSADCKTKTQQAENVTRISDAGIASLIARSPNGFQLLMNENK